MVRLLVNDPAGKVAAFFKKALAGWKYKNFYGIHGFFKGKENGAMRGKTPTVQIGDADLFKKTMPAAETSVNIWYQSGK